MGHKVVSNVEIVCLVALANIKLPCKEHEPLIEGWRCIDGDYSIHMY